MRFACHRTYPNSKKSQRMSQIAGRNQVFQAGNNLKISQQPSNEVSIREQGCIEQRLLLDMEKVQREFVEE
jgi:hypothetical protein